MKKRKRKLWAATVVLLIIGLALGIAWAAKWSDYGELAAANIADTDDFLVRDVSDTTLAATGTQKRYTWASLKTDLQTVFDAIYGTIAGETWTGTHDFGGADDLEIPNSASPTVDTAGQVAVDTTSDQFRYYGAAQRVIDYREIISVAILAPAATMEPHIVKLPYGITITDIHCITEAATSAVIDVQECDSAGANCATVDAAITCDTDGAEDDGSLSNGTIDANDWIKIDVGTVTGTVETVTVTIYATITAD